MSGRTHPPTPRRLREARRRGQVPVGRGLVATAALACGLAAAAWRAPRAVREVGRLLAASVEAAGLDGPAPQVAVARAATLLLSISAPPLLAAVAGAALAGGVQTGGLVAWQGAQPRWDRVSPARGLGRIFSAQGVATALLAAGWSLAALAATLAALRPHLSAVAQAPRLAPSGAFALAGSAALDAAHPALAVLAVAGGVELLLARRRHRDALRMTRAEVERDHREEEGDPRLRAERRRRHSSLAASTPARRLACVVVNPTHVAVALARCEGDLPPQVAWMASGDRAGKLRRLARRAGVPVVEDVLLARSLFRLAEVGELVPEELHEAVAVVLARLHHADLEGGRA